MSIPITVLFHAACPDGIASAFACWQQFGDEAQYIPVSYGQPCPDIPANHTVYIVDFSYPADTLRALLAARLSPRAPYVIVLDHHASAQRDLEPLQREALRGLDIRFDLQESGATLTWKYLHRYRSLSEGDKDPANMPLFFAYVRDRDLWQWRLPDSKAISLAYWTLDKGMQSIAAFAEALEAPDSYQRIVVRGLAMQDYANALVKEQAARAIIGTIGGYIVPIVNVTTLFSEVGDYLCTTHPNMPFCAYYFDRGSEGKRQWGLRGHGKVDLSVVAQQYGGGGHHDAVGFVTDTTFLPVNT